MDAGDRALASGTASFCGNSHGGRPRCKPIDGHREAPRNAPPDPRSGSAERLTEQYFSDAHEQSLALPVLDQVYSQTSPGKFRGSSAQVRVGRTWLVRETANRATYQCWKVPRGVYVFALVAVADGPSRCCGYRIGPNSLIVGQPGSTVSAALAPFEGFALIVEEAEVLSRLGGASVWALENASCPIVELSPQQGHRLTDALRGVCSGVRSSVSAWRAHQAETSRHEILDAICAALRLCKPTQTSGHRARTNHVRVVERVLQRVREQSAERIDAHDLCLEIGASRRSLHYAFETVVGIPPAQFLRMLRLNGVRWELRRGIADVSIGDVAARWGFWHMGRFAADYRRLFGELPSGTVQSMTGRRAAAAVARATERRAG